MRFDRGGWGLTERGEIWCQIVLSLTVSHLYSLSHRKSTI